MTRSAEYGLESYLSYLLIDCKPCTHEHAGFRVSVHIYWNGLNRKLAEIYFHIFFTLMNNLLEDRLVHAEAVFQFIKPNVLMQNLM